MLTIDTAINQSSGPKFFSILTRMYIRAITTRVVKAVNDHNTPRILGPRFSSSKSTILKKLHARYDLGSDNPVQAF